MIDQLKQHTAFVLLMLSPILGFAQWDDKSLLEEIERLDSLVFEAGFNNCELNIIDSITTEDLEFYHDKAGIQNKVEFMLAMKENICSTPDHKPIRKLVSGSTEIYPLYDGDNLYGVIQEGIHEFFIQENSKPLYKTSTAKFTTLWLLIDDEFKMKRILSYDHVAP